jgi:response regulator RpfG family c-di-GMP phosphodiesterase
MNDLVEISSRSVGTMNPSATARPREGAMITPQKLVALVIDDDKFTRLLLGRALRPYFDSVLCAYDATEAGWLCEAYPVTHVIVDHDLGLEMSGPQVVKELKSIRPEIAKVVLCSGSPFDPATLPECIDAFVRKGDGVRGLLRALRG